MVLELALLAFEPLLVSIPPFYVLALRSRASLARVFWINLI
jgi:hypothetical protein